MITRLIEMKGREGFLSKTLEHCTASTASTASLVPWWRAESGSSQAFFYGVVSFVERHKNERNRQFVVWMTNQTLPDPTKYLHMYLAYSIASIDLLQ